MCSFAWFLSFIMSVEVATLLYASDSLLFHSKYLFTLSPVHGHLHCSPLNPAMVSATQSIRVTLDGYLDGHLNLFSGYFPRIEVAESWDILPPSNIWEMCLFLHCFSKLLDKLVFWKTKLHLFYHINTVTKLEPKIKL